MGCPDKHTLTCDRKLCGKRWVTYLQEEVQQSSVVWAVHKVEFEQAVDAALQQDVVVARNHANLAYIQTYRAANR
jgi:hypothetical protein